MPSELTHRSFLYDKYGNPIPRSAKEGAMLFEPPSVEGTAYLPDFELILFKEEGVRDRDWPHTSNELQP